MFLVEVASDFRFLCLRWAFYFCDPICVHIRATSRGSEPFSSLTGKPLMMTPGFIFANEIRIGENTPQYLCIPLPNLRSSCKGNEILL